MNDQVKITLVCLSTVILTFFIIFLTQRSYYISKENIVEKTAISLLEQNDYKNITVNSEYLDRFNYPCYYTFTLWANWNHKREKDITFKAIKNNKAVEGYVCINFFEKVKTIVESQLPLITKKPQ